MKILIVDISNVFWSFALSGANAAGNAARDWALREIREQARCDPPYDRIVIAVDGDDRAEGWPHASWRVRHWPPYKAGRKTREPHLWRLLADTIKHCESEGWAVMRGPKESELDGTPLHFEADDVIASVCAWARSQKHTVDILSNDSDLAQLVVDEAPRVVQIRRVKKGTRVENEARVQEWLGVAPWVVPHLKALAGDSGDGYGDIFPGIGEIKAKEMLEKAGGSAINAAHKCVAFAKDAEGTKVKVPKNLAIVVASGGVERAKLGLMLAMVRPDVPLDFAAIEKPPVRTAEPSLAQNFVPDAELDDAEPEPELLAEATAQKELAKSSPFSMGFPAHQEDVRLIVSPREARNRLCEFQAMVKSILVPGTDYGKIPGCGDKPVLLKSGAEKLGEIYGFAASFELVKHVEKWGSGNASDAFFFYLFRCVLRRKADGSHVGECLGSANSREKKWGARWVFEGEVPPHLDLDGLKQKQVQTRNGEATKYQIPNEEIFDQVNTLQKMAQKRSFVGAVVIATRASGIFMTDLDDMRENHFGEAEPTPQWRQK